MLYKDIDFTSELAGLIRHMSTVEEYREILQGLSSAWDNLTLLGQLSGAAADMGETQQAFKRLTSSLLNRLGEETLKKCIEEMAAKAQVAIDILIRNLFERTADIGFLATDDDICRFIAVCAQDSHASLDDPSLSIEKQSIRQRFAEYVAKYSVYFDIVLLDTSGTVLVRLDENIDVGHTIDPLVAASLETNDAYIENYGAFDLFPDQDRTLVYSYRVADSEKTPIGVLCLCFRFENEMERIFKNLASPEDWSVILLLDEVGTVIASSDIFHIPLGVHFDKVVGATHRIDRFAGREYLVITRDTHGYQGYTGPGWSGHVMLPLQHAFDNDVSDVLRGVNSAALRTIMSSSALFGEELRSIPLQANRIQSELNRSVWNGNVRQSADRKASSTSFSKILLWEISKTGGKTKDVFARSIANLHETVVSSILQDSRFFASLAIDILDRNLYERANDCRWWALTSSFRALLVEDGLSSEKINQITAVLQTINKLYSVYSNLIVFDRNGCVLSVSQPEESGIIGHQINEDWVRRVLSLSDSQGYAVSDFSATPLYGGRHTYIYGAAIRALEGDGVIGGIGIVFDSAPQFAAMLQDALPRNACGEIGRGTFGAFVDASGRIIAATDAAWKPGEMLPVDSTFFSLDNGEGKADIALLGNTLFAIGARMSSGYREYKGAQDDYQNNVVALVFVPLCKNDEMKRQTEIMRPTIRSDQSNKGETVEIATFLIGHKWFGLRADKIVESVDFKGAMSVPGAGANLAGYLMYKGVPIAIFDISGIVNAGSTSLGANQQAIILRRNENAQFGILVDDLGEIPEVLTSRIQRIPELIAGGNALADSIIMTDKPETETLLAVLSVDRITARLVHVSLPQLEDTNQAS